MVSVTGEFGVFFHLEEKVRHRQKVEKVGAPGIATSRGEKKSCFPKEKTLG